MTSNGGGFPRGKNTSTASWLHPPSGPRYIAAGPDSRCSPAPSHGLPLGPPPRSLPGRLPWGPAPEPRRPLLSWASSCCSGPAV
eukprot:5803183-Heterocapsa_arctica.AAC.1